MPLDTSPESIFRTQDAYAKSNSSLRECTLKLKDAEIDISNQRQYIFNLEQKLQELQRELRIGDIVEVNTNSLYYEDWKGEQGEIVGINRFNNQIEYTTISNGMTYDGWKESELSRVISSVNESTLDSFTKERESIKRFIEENI